MQRSNFGFLTAGSLALLLAMTPAVLAQAIGATPAGGAPDMNNSSNSNNYMGAGGMMAPDGMGAPGRLNTLDPDQTTERNTFGNLRKNFDAENELSKMALKKSRNDDVKKFAHRAINENHDFSDDLRVPNPTGDMMDPEMMSSQTKKAEEQMKKLTGKPFDQMYLVQMDAYIKDDQQVAQKAEGAATMPKMSEVGTRVRGLSEDREKQIDMLVQETGFRPE